MAEMGFDFPGGYGRSFRSLNVEEKMIVPRPRSCEKLGRLTQTEHMFPAAELLRRSRRHLQPCEASGTLG